MRVAMAVALYRRPDVIILDEVFILISCYHHVRFSYRDVVLSSLRIILIATLFEPWLKLWKPMRFAADIIIFNVIIISIYNREP
jgi:hypothetical protein